MTRRILAGLLVTPFALAFLLFPLAAFGDSSGPLDAGTCANDTTVGSTAWSSPTNAQTSNNTRTLASIGGANTSNYLKCTNFGFAIPSGATINGLTLEIERRSNNAIFEAKDLKVVVVKADGTFGTTDKADTATVYPTTDTYKTYGGAADLWGESWTDASVNDSDFGFALQVQKVDSTGIPEVDHFRVTITYTPAAGGGTQQSQVRVIQYY